MRMGEQWMVFILQYILAPVLMFVYIADFIGSMLLSFVFYTLLFYPIYLALRSHQISRWLVPLTLVVMIGIGPPYYLNSFIQNYTSELQKNDIDISQPIELQGTIAVISPDFYRENRYAEKSPAVTLKQCAELCQKLLYGEEVSYVILANNNEINSEHARRFYIKKKDECPKYYRFHKDVLGFVKLKMIDGYCLTSDEANVNEANIIYKTENLNPATRLSFLSNLISIPATRHSVITKKDGNKRIVFQQTNTRIFEVYSPLQLFFRDGSIKIKQNIPLISLQSKSEKTNSKALLEKIFGQNDNMDLKNKNAKPNL